MALVAAAVANGGEVMTPHVVREVRDDQGEVVDTIPTDDVWTRAMELRDRGPAAPGDDRGGPGRHRQPPRRRPRGFEVGKTGNRPDRLDRQLARRSSASPDPGEAPSVAVAVIVEAQPGVSEQTGGRVAAPIAAAVMRQVSGTAGGAG